MILCAPMVPIRAPIKKQELSTPTAKELSLFSFKITPMELTIKALPANKNVILAKSAVMDLMIFFGLISSYIQHKNKNTY